MSTAYSTVFDSFMMKIKDWRLDTLYQASVPDFETYLIGFLKSAVVMFKKCNQSLSRDDTAKTFDEDLTDENIELLGKLMVEAWLEKEVQNITQMSLTITDKDFKHYSEAQNLKEKSARWNEVRERNSQDLVSYGYDQDSTWASWLSGDFYTPGS